MNNYDCDLTYYSRIDEQNFLSNSGYYNTLRVPYMQTRPHINPNFQNKYKQQKTEESHSTNKVLINPHFRSNVYVNPNFLPPPPNVATNVYVNPKILSESTIKNINLVQNRSNISTVIKTNVQTDKISPTTTKVSKYKLVRNIPSTKLSKYKLVRAASPLKTVIIKTPHRTSSNISKFKLDRRIPKIIRKLPSKVVKTSNSNRLVNISGTLYKTNRNKLQRTGTTTVDLPKEKRVKKVSVTKVNTRFRYVGQTEVKKVIKDSPKNKIRRVSLRLNAVKLSSRFKLIYKNKTPINRKIKISSRKMKSASKYRKNNIPCPLFTQKGKCPSHEKGTCRRLHDPKMISICKKFLQGECHIENCLLSHNVSLEKMPTCKFYLNGFCSREVCPYLHVKLSDAAEICRNFLNGFCAAADKCDKRHIYMCPEMDRTGKCAKSKCSYPHNSAVGKKSLIFKPPKSCKKNKKSSKIPITDKTETELFFTDTQAVEDNDNAQTVRYFIKNSDEIEDSQFSLKSDLTCDYFKESCPDFIPFI